jgi:hypothetical protein
LHPEGRLPTKTKWLLVQQPGAIKTRRESHKKPKEDNMRPLTDTELDFVAAGGGSLIDVDVDVDIEDSLNNNNVAVGVLSDIDQRQ